MAHRAMMNTAAQMLTVQPKTLIQLGPDLANGSRAMIGEKDFFARGFTPDF